MGRQAASTARNESDTAVTINIKLAHTTIPVTRQIEDQENLALEDAWKKIAVIDKFDLLSKFAIGLASIAPGTHTVEGDFSTLKRTKGPHRGRLSNYAMEAELQSRRVDEIGRRDYHFEGFQKCLKQVSQSGRFSKMAPVDMPEDDTFKSRLIRLLPPSHKTFNISLFLP
ncbi:hypothetical protein GQ600_19956 [Phytophthora cactorum]|nr:hypothetical protein GQ600_19956 [Phytophthora cactorum]